MSKIIILLVWASTAQTIMQPSVAKENQRAELRVTTVQLARVMEATYDSSGEPVLVSGLAFQYLEWLTQRYKWKHEVTRFYSPDGFQIISSGTYANGSWNGVIGDLINDVADIALGPYGAKINMVPYVDITYPYWPTSFSMFIPYPVAESSIWAFLKPFTPQVWFAVLASYLAVCLTLWVLQSPAKPNVTKTQKKVAFGTLALSLLAVFTGQGGGWNYHGKVLFTLGCTWCTASLVIVNAFNGLLASFLSTTSPRPFVSSLVDLASKPEIQYYTFQNSWIVYAFTQAESGITKKLGEGFRNHQERLLPSYMHCLEQVEKSPSVCFTETASAESFIEKRLKQTGKCTITNIERSFLRFNMVFFMRKNSTFFSQVNQGTIWANAMGLGPRWIDQLNARTLNCKPPKATFTSAKPLKLQNLSGPFVLLLIGSLTGAVVFIIEIVHYRILQKP